MGRGWYEQMENEMSIFDQQAIEDVAHAISDVPPYSVAKRALQGLFRSWQDRGLIKSGVGYIPEEWDKEWFARNKKGSYIGEVSVAIIRTP